jgi:lipid-binding SYLF domain-containing protein
MTKPSGLAFLLVALLMVSACTTGQPLRNEAESLVSKSYWTVENFKTNTIQPPQVFNDALKDAHGIVVFPAAFKGAFIFGAEGGNGVLLSRTDAGEWGYPAFYTMGSGSFGLQVGAQASEVILVLRSPEAVRAVINNQGKLGGDIQFTVGMMGAGLQGATTTNLGADIVGFARGEGFFAGFSLEGAVLAARNDLNQAYYGEPGATATSIAVENRFMNAQADPLRESLGVETRLSAIEIDTSAQAVELQPNGTAVEIDESASTIEVEPSLAPVTR